jgi:hypothetical protein
MVRARPDAKRRSSPLWAARLRAPVSVTHEAIRQLVAGRFPSELRPELVDCLLAPFCESLEPRQHPRAQPGLESDIERRRHKDVDKDSARAEPGRPAQSVGQPRKRGCAGEAGGGLRQERVAP